MKIITDFIKWFFYITSSIMLVCAVVFLIQDMEVLPKYTLWYILLSGFMSALVTELTWGFSEPKQKSVFFLKIFLHYVALCAVMIVSGHWFGWLDYDFSGILMMAVSVAAVYVLSIVSDRMLDSRQAEEINRRLKEKYRDET